MHILCVLARWFRIFYALSMYVYMYVCIAIIKYVTELLLSLCCYLVYIQETHVHTKNATPPTNIKDVPVQKPVATGLNRFDLLIEESLPQQVWRGD